MADKRKARLLAEVNNRLSAEQRRLLELVSIETRKDKLVFRMPVGVFSLDEVSAVLEATADSLKIPFSKSEPFASLCELDDILGDIEWLWENWLPRGFITTLVGDPGIGKSIVAMDFARIVTLGDKARWPLSNKSPKVNNVVWIDSEASQQLLNIRSKDLGMQRERVFIPIIDGDILGQPNILLEEHRNQITNLIVAKKPALVILDSLGGAQNRGENKVEEMRPIMDFFAWLARDYSLSVIVVHHLNKGLGNSTEVDLYRLRGSTIIPAMSRVIIAIEEVSDKAVRMRMIKSNISMKQDSISIIIQNDGTGRIKGIDYAPYVAPAKKQTKRETCAVWITKTLTAYPDGIQLKDLCTIGEGEGFTRGNIYNARDVLSDRIVITGNGREAIWHLNEAEADTESIAKLISANKKDGE